MIDLFVEREYSPALTRQDVFTIAASAGGCFGLYKINWIESLLAIGGERMLCHFQAPDTDSLRTAFRQTSGVVPKHWRGVVHPGSRLLPEGLPGTHQVLVLREFAKPVRLEAIQAIEDAGAWCLETRNVHFEKTFFSLDQRRMACLYRAPDAEAVREAQRQAGVPFSSIWACDRITPEDMPSR